jgi:hypothetical protein
MIIRREHYTFGHFRKAKRMSPTNDLLVTVIAHLNNPTLNVWALDSSQKFLKIIFHG